MLVNDWSQTLLNYTVARMKARWSMMIYQFTMICPLKTCVFPYNIAMSVVLMIKSTINLYFWWVNQHKSTISRAIFYVANGSLSRWSIRQSPIFGSPKRSEPKDNQTGASKAVQLLGQVLCGGKLWGDMVIKMDSCGENFNIGDGKRGEVKWKPQSGW